MDSIHRSISVAAETNSCMSCGLKLAVLEEGGSESATHKSTSAIHLSFMQMVVEISFGVGISRSKQFRHIFLDERYFTSHGHTNRHKLKQF